MIIFPDLVKYLFGLFNSLSFISRDRDLLLAMSNWREWIGIGGAHTHSKHVFGLAQQRQAKPRSESEPKAKAKAQQITADDFQKNAVADRFEKDRSRRFQHPRPQSRLSASSTTVAA